MTDQELMQSTHEEQVFWLKCVAGLPGLEGFNGTGYDANGIRIPWGSGPHNLSAYRQIANIVNPISIFEIGFNVGYSAAMWLEITKATIFTIDISDKAETLAAADVLRKRYPGRFDFKVSTTSTLSIKEPWDMAFIDGGHLEEEVTQDIQFCLDNGIDWLVMDDWLPNFGPGVQISVAKFPLDVVLVIGNTALVKRRK